jgi:hypothetical protein
VFTRAQLLQEVWGYDFFGGTRTVDVHVRRLRAKLGAEHEQMIGTVRNVGYKFVRPTGRAGPAEVDARLRLLRSRPGGDVGGSRAAPRTRLAMRSTDTANCPRGLRESCGTEPATWTWKSSRSTTWASRV